MSTSAWDLPWQERAEINQMYADMYAEMSEEEKRMVDSDNYTNGPWVDNSKEAYLKRTATYTAARELEELRAATSKFGPFHSAHEGFSILKEEVDELWEEVRAKQGSRNNDRLRKEAVQVAAMAMRFIIDICDNNQEQV